MKRMKLSTKLIGLFVLIGLVPFFSIAFYTYISMNQNLGRISLERLSFARQSKIEEIGRYFETIRNQVITFSEDQMVKDAMVAFSYAFDKVEEENRADYYPKLQANEDRLMARYLHQEANTKDAPDNAVTLWWPERQVTRILQHYYISANPFPVGEKQKLEDARDDSTYSQVHQIYHPTIRSYLEKFGYYDIFFINAETGDIVYTVFKELDYCTNLLSGPYSKSNLARVFARARNAENKDQVFFADFEPYTPSYNMPTAFIASPIYSADKKVGVLAFQIPIDRINRIMNANHEWTDVGMGKTGESILVGPDRMFRSNSRMLIESPTHFFNIMENSHEKPSIVERIKTHNTVIGILQYKDPLVDEALKLESGVTRATDYLGREVLMAYGPLKLPGVTWAVLATMEESEAFASIWNLRKVMLILGFVGALAVMLVGFYFSRSISKPLNEIIGVLSTSSTQIAATVEQQEKIIQQQATAVQETNTTMEELGASSSTSAGQAQTAAGSSAQVLELSREGSMKMQGLVESMDQLQSKVDDIAHQILQLSEQTGQIENITRLVTDFANETKMLAMNAAVEAVRAGEHGKGFSVLSVEIRKLADESKRSAERISALVADIQKVTNATVMSTEEGGKSVVAGANLANDTAQTFDRMTDAVNEASESAQQISLNVQQQAIAVKQVVEAMNTLYNGAKESSIGISQVKIGIQTLNDAAGKLRKMV